MGKFAHLTKERELELGEIIQRRATMLAAVENGAEAVPEIAAAGEDAIDELVKANLGLVWDRALAFKNKYPSAPEMEDLVSMGFIGLMVAVHKYDPTRGNKFSTVAYYWIAQAIGREVNKTGRMVRLPENRIMDYSRMNAVATRYEEVTANSLSIDHAIADELGLSKVEIMNIRNAAVGHSSLNRKVGGDESAKELMDVVGEEQSLGDTETTVANRECFTILQQALKELPFKQCRVVCSYFSLEFEGTYPSPQQVKEEYELTPSKYRRMLRDGLDTLKNSLAGQELALPDFLTSSL